MPGTVQMQRVRMLARYKRNLPGDVCSFPLLEAASLVSHGGAVLINDEGQPQGARVEPGPEVITTVSPTGTGASARPLGGVTVDPRGGGFFDVIGEDGQPLAQSVRRAEADAAVARAAGAARGAGSGPPSGGFGATAAATQPGAETQPAGPAGGGGRPAMPGYSNEPSAGDEEGAVAQFSGTGGLAGDPYPLNRRAEDARTRTVRAQRVQEGDEKVAEKSDQQPQQPGGKPPSDAQQDAEQQQQLEQQRQQQAEQQNQQQQQQGEQEEQGQQGKDDFQRDPGAAAEEDDGSDDDGDKPAGRRTGGRARR